MPQKTVESYFPLKAKDFGLVPCLSFGKGNIITRDDISDLDPEDTTFLVYDLPVDQAPPKTREEALGMCDAAMC